MLVGYLNLGDCIEKIIQMEDSDLREKINKSRSDALKLYQNGHQLAKQFWGDQNLLTKCFKKRLAVFKLREESFKTSDKSKHSSEPEKSPTESTSSISEGVKQSHPIFDVKIPRAMTPDSKRRSSKEFIIHSSSSVNNSRIVSDSVTRLFLIFAAY